MNTRSCWLLVAVVIVGTAQAQVTAQSYPSTSPGYTAPSPTPPIPQCPQPPPSVYAPAPGAGWALTVVEGSKLRVLSSDGIEATCEKMTIPVQGGEPLQVSVDGQVHINSVCRTGPCDNRLEASADRVTRSGPSGAVLTLEGKAKVRWVRQGMKAEIAAGQITLNLMTGQIECNLTDATMPQPVVVPVQGTPPMPAYPTYQ